MNGIVLESPADLWQYLPKREEDSHKGTYGKVLVIGGALNMAGAAYFTAHSAYAVGSGLVRIYTHSGNRIPLQQLLPEAVLITYEEFEEKKLQEQLDWCSVIAIGPGLSVGESARQMVRKVLAYAGQCKKPCVIDADALNILAQERKWLQQGTERWILTPHAGEFARLADRTSREILVAPKEILGDFVKKYGVICLLKGYRTLVCQKEDDFYTNVSGNTGLAKGGSGDVLTGVIAGLLAQGLAPYEAAVCGVYLHGLGAEEATKEKGVCAMLARDTIEGIGVILRKLYENKKVMAEHEYLQENIRTDSSGSYDG